jgi:hypothetical protein
MTAREINLSRDDENDVLYVTKNGIDKNSTINLDVDSDITIRFDRFTHEVVGFTITDFGKSVLGFLKNYDDYRLMEEFGFIINSLNVLHRVEHQAA